MESKFIVIGYDSSWKVHKASQPLSAFGAFRFITNKLEADPKVIRITMYRIEESLDIKK